MRRFVSLAAYDQGLAMARGHPHGPFGHFCPPLASEILQRTNVVHLDVLLGATELAGVGEEPFEQFCLSIPDGLGLVAKDCVFSSSTRHAAPVRYQRWTPSISFNYHLQTSVRAGGRTG